MKIIALDIGGTAVKSGLVDNGVLKEHRETPTPAAEGGQAVVALAKKLIAAYLPEGADGIGISTAGVVDSKSGSILFAEDCIRGYTGIQVKALLEDAFSLPTAVENDLNAAAVGEAAFGAGKAPALAARRCWMAGFIPALISAPASSATWSLTPGAFPAAAAKGAALSGMPPPRPWFGRLKGWILLWTAAGRFSAG